MSFDILSDFWDDYNYKEMIESIWENYEEFVAEEENLLEQIDDSKSILSLPYEFELRWKKLKWKVVEDLDGTKLDLLTNFDNEILTNVKVKEDDEYFLLDEDYNPVKIYDDDDNKIEYEIKVIDRPFKDEETPYNPIEFRKKSNKELIPVNKLGDYFKDGFLQLWAKRYYIHNRLVLELYGELTELNKTIYDLNYYSKMYFNMVKAMWYILVNGPTIKNLKIGIFLFFNLPIILKEASTIEIWEEGHIKLSSGEEWVFGEELTLIEGYYDEDNNYVPITGEGQEIPRFVFLVEGIEIKDYLTHPEWWVDYDYFGGAIDIEKYSTSFISIDSNSFGTMTRDLTILGDFLERVVPQYVKLILALMIDLDNYPEVDEIGVEDDSNLSANTYLYDKRPEYNDTTRHLNGLLYNGFTYNGEIRYDNLDDNLKITIEEDGTPLDRYIMVY
jgi:hypothetical protein